jgi:DNA-binding NarL/FixJ family response regulator
MGLTILIAESRDILRTGLHTIFVSDRRVSQIYEAKTQEEVQRYMSTRLFDLLVINQQLIRDISLLPPGKFVILTSELDITLFQNAYERRARAYLLESASADLFHAILSCEEGAFLIEPVLAAQIIEYVSSDPRLAVSSDLLTPREREIIDLLQKGVDRHTIAQRLCISEATLKTHIKNITRKRKDSAPPVKRNPLLQNYQ